MTTTALAPPLDVAYTPRRGRAWNLLLVPALAFLLLLSGAPAAYAAAPEAVAVASTAAPSHLAYSYTDCAGVAAGFAGARFSPYALVASVIYSVPCGSWLGGVNAGWICWGSRQWWGSFQRFAVRVMTSWRYSTC